MNFIKRFWREVCLCVLGLLLYQFLYLWTHFRPENIYLESLLFIGMAADIVGIFLMVRELWRKKWSKMLSDSFGKIFDRLRKLMAKLADKITIASKDDSVLRGKTTFSFDKIESISREKTVKTKPPKWRQLKEDREKMRYLYRGMITARLRRGELIYSDETPSEIEGRGKLTADERELFDMYVEARYDERKAVDGEKVKNLKEKLEIK